MMKSFAINDTQIPFASPIQTMNATIVVTNKKWRKLFTREDPTGLHKLLGVFVLLHFIYRYGQMIFTGEAIHVPPSRITNPNHNRDLTILMLH